MAGIAEIEAMVVATNSAMTTRAGQGGIRVWNINPNNPNAETIGMTANHPDSNQALVGSSTSNRNTPTKWQSMV